MVSYQPCRLASCHSDRGSRPAREPFGKTSLAQAREDLSKLNLELAPRAPVATLTASARTRVAGAPRVEPQQGLTCRLAPGVLPSASASKSSRSLAITADAPRFEHTFDRQRTSTVSELEIVKALRLRRRSLAPFRQRVGVALHVLVADTRQPFADAPPLPSGSNTPCWITPLTVATASPLPRLRGCDPARLLAAGGASRHVVGLLTPALLLCQKRRHRARANPGLPERTRRECAPTPNAGFCSLGTMRKLVAPRTSLRSAAVMPTLLRTADLSCAPAAPCASVAGS